MQKAQAIRVVQSAVLLKSAQGITSPPFRERGQTSTYLSSMGVLVPLRPPLSVVRTNYEYLPLANFQFQFLFQFLIGKIVVCIAPLESHHVYLSLFSRVRRNAP